MPVPLTNPVSGMFSAVTFFFLEELLVFGGASYFANSDTPPLLAVDLFTRTYDTPSLFEVFRFFYFSLTLQAILIQDYTAVSQILMELKEIPKCSLWQPLHYAVAMDDLRMADLILKRGHPIDCAGGDLLISPIDIAVLHANFPMLELLMQYNPKLQEQHRFKTPLYFAVSGFPCANQKQAAEDPVSECERIITTLLRFKAPILVPGMQSTPLHQTAVLGRPSLFVILSEAAHISNFCNFDNSEYGLEEHKRTVLMQACNRLDLTEGKLCIVQIILEKMLPSANLILLPKFPLHIAASSGFPQAIELVTHKEYNSSKLFKVDCFNKYGCTPLCTAIMRQDSECVTALLEAGAEVSQPDPHGLLPLHYAAMSSSAEIIKTLLANGADITHRSIHGITPGDIAICLNSLPEISQQLECPKDKQEVSFSTCIVCTSIPVLPVLLPCCAKLCCRSCIERASCTDCSSPRYHKAVHHDIYTRALASIYCNNILQYRFRLHSDRMLGNFVHNAWSLYCKDGVFEVPDIVGSDITLRDTTLCFQEDGEWSCLLLRHKIDISIPLNTRDRLQLLEFLLLNAGNGSRTLGGGFQLLDNTCYIWVRVLCSLAPHNYAAKMEPYMRDACSAWNQSLVTVKNGPSLPPSLGIPAIVEDMYMQTEWTNSIISDSLRKLSKLWDIKLDTGYSLPAMFPLEQGLFSISSLDMPPALLFSLSINIGETYVGEDKSKLLSFYERILTLNVGVSAAPGCVILYINMPTLFLSAGFPAVEYVVSRLQKAARDVHSWLHPPKSTARTPSLMNLRSRTLSLKGLSKPSSTIILDLQLDDTIQELNLSNNKLKNLPRTVFDASQLTILDLSGNQLATLPEEIGSLVNLTSLDLSGNELQTLPKSIGNLKKLQFLNLRNNLLQALPHEVTHLTTLKQLTIADNPLSFLPNRGKGLKTNEILDILSKMQSDTVELGILKLMVVGAAGTGKTTLVSALRKTVTQDISSLGVNITEYTSSSDQGSIHFIIWVFTFSYQFLIL